MEAPDLYAGDSAAYDGWANLPALFLRCMTVHPYFGDIVKSALLMLLLFSGSIYSQNEENPWLFEFGINSVNAEESNKSSYRLPSLSLSRYIFNNFSVGVNYSQNDLEISNEDLYYY
jgi:hypothetical protein